jgi:hypothetical protein
MAAAGAKVRPRRSRYVGGRPVAGHVSGLCLVAFRRSVFRPGWPRILDPALAGEAEAGGYRAIYLARFLHGCCDSVGRLPHWSALFGWLAWLMGFYLRPSRPEPCGGHQLHLPLVWPLRRCGQAWSCCVGIPYRLSLALRSHRIVG